MQRTEPRYLIVLGASAQIQSRYPAPKPDHARQIGFGAVLYTLITAVDALRRQVTAVLDEAEATGYPVMIHLDDWNYTPKDWADPCWIEWSDFPKRGERYGPVIRRRWLNWGSWMALGPPPNYESQMFRAYVRERVREGIARPLADRYRQWTRAGRGHLLAGLVVGWESGYYSAREIGLDDRPRDGEAVFDDAEKVRAGYAALYSRGWTAEKLERTARRRGIPSDHLFRELMATVVQRYVSELCRICVQAGVPRSRIYTHLTAAITQPGAPPEPEDGRLLPIGVACNPYSRPGLTMTEPWCSLDAVIGALRQHRRREWGAVEYEVTESTRDTDAGLRYLERLTQEGARVICVYGWWDPPGTPFAVLGTGAPEAFSRWLAAESGPSDGR